MSTSLKIKVIGEVKKEDFYCGLCKYPLIISNDFETSDEYQCCFNCYLEFVESRKNMWKQGWRPDKKELDSYISIRHKIHKKVNKEK
jgi:hypothetical protein